VENPEPGTQNKNQHCLKSGWLFLSPAPRDHVCVFATFGPRSVKCIN